MSALLNLQFELRLVLRGWPNAVISKVGPRKIKRGLGVDVGHENMCTNN